jgi:LemA protein
LTSTENKVAFARQAYNDSVMFYNTAREKFPEALYSSFFGFKEAALLKLESEVKKAAPKVQFG